MQAVRLEDQGSRVGPQATWNPETVASSFCKPISEGVAPDAATVIL